MLRCNRFWRISVAMRKCWLNCWAKSSIISWSIRDSFFHVAGAELCVNNQRIEFEQQQQRNHDECFATRMNVHTTLCIILRWSNGYFFYLFGWKRNCRLGRYSDLDAIIGIDEASPTSPMTHTSLIFCIFQYSVINSSIIMHSHLISQQ